MKSRFYFHCIFRDLRDTSGKFAAKLAKTLAARFPDANLLEAKIDYPTYRCLSDGLGEPLKDANIGLPFEVSRFSLFIGIGSGALLAYKLQNAGYRGVSLIAACPPPGITHEPEGGPKVILYGTKDGVYKSRKVFDPRHEPQDLPGVDSQMYGLPSLTHGPELAFYAISHLVGKYMENSDLSETIKGLTL